MDARSIAIIASQEQRVTLRSRWVQIFAVTFALLTLAISYFGMATSVVVGSEGFTRTTASLLNLVLYLIPLIALTAGTLSFSGEEGAAEMLFAQPVLRSEILVGKVLGLFCSLAMAVVFGFGVSGIVIAARSTTTLAVVVLSSSVGLWVSLVMLLAAWRLGRREI
jgi:Cu-processing system permease protein